MTKPIPIRFQADEALFWALDRCAEADRISNAAWIRTTLQKELTLRGFLRPRAPVKKDTFRRRAPVIHGASRTVTARTK